VTLAYVVARGPNPWQRRDVMLLQQLAANLVVGWT